MARRAQASHTQIKQVRGPIEKVQKRDGSVVDFDITRITNAVNKAMLASGEGSEEEASYIARKVFSELARIKKLMKGFIPDVEGIQDLVEKELILEDFVQTAKGYILYREERSKLRRYGVQVSERVRKLTEESKKYFKDNPLGEFVYLRTYARWIPSENRRETWIETVDRYISFMQENLGDKLKERD